MLDPAAENELAAWSPEWVASAILLATALVYVRGWLRGERDRARLGAFLGAIALLAIAIASPLEALDDSYLSAHMTQHFLLMMAAPPLLLAGHPFVPFLARIAEGLGEARVEAAARVARADGGYRRWLTAPPVAGVLFAASMIFWHIPRLFELALASPFWHDIEHATFFWGGILFWWPILESKRWPRWVSIPYLLFGDLINTAVAAFFVFSGRVLYPSYAAARVSGLSALDDQVLAGLIMWVPGSIVYLVPAFVITMRVSIGRAGTLKGRPIDLWSPIGYLYGYRYRRLIEAMSRPTDLVQGTLDLLILKILALQPMHGWAIAERMKQMSKDILQVGPGSLYPALHKLEKEGWVEAEWSVNEAKRRVKFYSITKEGRKRLEQEAAGWKRLSGAISSIVFVR